MKKSFIAGLIALSFGISAQAYAKDLNAIDVLVGDFSGIATIDVDKLAANKMIGDALNKNQSALDKELAILKEAGIDYKKDIDSVTIAATDKGTACFVVDAKISLVEAIPKLAASNANLKIIDYNGIKLYDDNSETAALISDKRLIGCQNAIDIKPSIDNARSDKPKTLKDRNSTLNSMYGQTPSSADIRAAGKMSSHMRKQVASYKLDGENGATLKVEDIDAGSVSISFANGLDIQAIAKMKSDASASTGSTILNATVSSLLSDPSLKEMGLDFLANAVKIQSDKKNLKGQIKLNNDQLSTLVILAGALAGGAQ